jgi:hypothetical protein
MSLLHYKLNFIYKFVVLDVRKRSVASACRPKILNILISYYDGKVQIILHTGYKGLTLTAHK